MSNPDNKTVFITGATSGTGKAIALRVARDVADIVVAKSAGPDSDASVDNSHCGMLANALRRFRRLVTACASRASNCNVLAPAKKAVDIFGGIDLPVHSATTHEEVPLACGVRDFGRYAFKPGKQLYPDLCLD